MKHFKKIESKFLFSLLIMSVWSIIAVGQTTAKISKYIPEIENGFRNNSLKEKHLRSRLYVTGNLPQNLSANGTIPSKR